MRPSHPTCSAADQTACQRSKTRRNLPAGAQVNDKALAATSVKPHSWDPSPHRLQQLSAVAGPLGRTLPDLFAVADEPYSEELRPMLHCHHLGRVFAAAVPLTTAQLIETAGGSGSTERA
jgi:hypothetical protein